jgi:hypothetical protein
MTSENKLLLPKSERDILEELLEMTNIDVPMNEDIEHDF